MENNFMKKVRSLGDIFYQVALRNRSIAFFCSVSLNLNGSSIANWNNFGVRETVSGVQSETKDS